MTATDLPAQIYVVTPQQAGHRLDRALTALMPEISRSRLQDLIGKGAVTLNGHNGQESVAIKDPNHRVKGDVRDRSDVGRSQLTP